MFTLLTKTTFSELRRCVKVEVAVLSSPSLIVVRTVSVDVKQHRTRNKTTVVLAKNQSMVNSVKR